MLWDSRWATFLLEKSSRKLGLTRMFPLLLMNCNSYTDSVKLQRQNQLICYQHHVGHQAPQSNVVSYFMPSSPPMIESYSYSLSCLSFVAPIPPISLLLIATIPISLSECTSPNLTLRFLTFLENSTPSTIELT